MIPIFMWLAMHDRPLTITGTGDETRDFAYVEDIVEGVLRMGVIDAAIGEAINLATGKEVSIKEPAEHVIDITGSKAGIVYAPKRDWDKSTRRRASIEKARKLIGYEPKMEFRQGLENVYKWLKEHEALIEESVPPSLRLW